MIAHAENHARLHGGRLFLEAEDEVRAREDGFERRLHRGGGLREFGFHPDDGLLRLVALDLPLEGNPFADGLGGLGVGVVGEGAGDDRLKGGDGRLGEFLIAGRLHLFPKCRPGAGRGTGNKQDSQDKGGEKA